MTNNPEQPTRVLLGGSRGEVAVPASGEPLTVSWPQCGEPVTVVYRQAVDLAKREIEISTRLSGPDAMDAALTAAREILEANGFDQESGRIFVKVFGGH